MLSYHREPFVSFFPTVKPSAPTGLFGRLLVSSLWLVAAQVHALDVVWNAATDVPVTAVAYTATGQSVNFTLNFIPAPGTELKVVNNTGLPFINGTFNNLAQGQSVVLSYGGIRYPFVANYFGGTGNDLVLVWAATRVLEWGWHQGTVPAVVNSLAGKTVVALAAGDSHSLALCSDGSVFPWGDNSYGQLGKGYQSEGWGPILALSLNRKTVVAIAAGIRHSLALYSDGTLAAWGDNSVGQLGDGTTMRRYTPVPVSVTQGQSALAGKTVVAIAAGDSHSEALCSDGTVATWGLGGLGTGAVQSNTHQPRAINMTPGTSALAGKTVVSITSGYLFCQALCSDGTVVGWGQNDSGQVGDNSSNSRYVPVAVNADSGVSALFGKTVTMVASGGDHNIALCQDGTLAGWGYNATEQLGQNDTKSRLAPVPLTEAQATPALAGKTIVALSAGVNYSLALCGDGTLAAWGGNSAGQLGTGGPTVNHLPETVTSPVLGIGDRFVRLFKGATSLQPLAVVATPAPVIAVEQPVGSILTNTSPAVDVGSASVGDSAGAKSFTVKNTAGIDLSNLVIKLYGYNAADFTAGALGSTTLSPGASTTFAMNFQPGGLGPRYAFLRIESQVGNVASADIMLTGTGLDSSIIFPTALTLVNEGDGTVNVPVIRTGLPIGAVSIRVNSSNGTATSNDYVSVNNVLVSFAAGESTQTIPVTINADALNEPNEAFTLTLSDPQGGVVLGSPATTTIRIIDPNDTTKPHVTITAPTANASFAEGAAVNVTGAATDNKGVLKVQYSLNSAAFADATTTVSSSGLSAGFTAVLAPVPGVNTVAVKSIDTRNNESTVVTRSFNYDVMRPLSVTITGSGTVPLPISAASYKVGFHYTLMAKPAAGQVFNGWTVNDATGTAITPAMLALPSLTFTHQQGLALTAAFIPNPFAVTGVVGGFNGLVSADVANSVAPGNDNSGFITLTVTTAGSFTGTLKIDGLSLSLAGAFDNSGHAVFGAGRAGSVVIARPGAPIRSPAFSARCTAGACCPGPHWWPPAPHSAQRALCPQTTRSTKATTP